MAGLVLLGSLAGCATLHGVRINLSGVDSSPFMKACLEEALHKAGLDVEHADANRLRVGMPGQDGHLFSVLFERPGPRAPWGASLYRFAAPEPIPCEVMQQVVPKMRAAAAEARKSCSTPTRRVDAVEVWSQPRCGL